MYRSLVVVARRGTFCVNRPPRIREPGGVELARIAAGRRAGAEGQEGLRAFLEKRKAELVGLTRYAARS
jgi:hypothetical protein